MADRTIRELTQITTCAYNDILPIVDVSDTSMSASGTTKQITVLDMMGSQAENALSYGARFDSSTNTWTRLGTTVGETVGVKANESLLAIQSAMHACIVNDNLELQYFLNDSNHNLKEDGSAATLTGADGQVMIRVPKFYYKMTAVSSTVIEFRVSFIRLSEYKVSPMHYRAGKELDYAHVGKYPGVLYDATVSNYIDGDGTAQADSTVDKLSSISGKKPFSYATRDAFRDMAVNRGTKFFQFDAATRASLLLLLITEYATGDFQTAISAGNTQFSAFSFASCISATGKSNSDGMTAGGQSTVGGAASDYVTWRGIEDLWGNLVQWLDGLNVYNVEADGKSYAYFSDNPANFADDTMTNYENKEELPLTDGYITMIGELLLPTVLGGASNTHFADYFWTYYNDTTAGYGTDWRVVRVCGNAANGVAAGVSSLNADSDSVIATSSTGGRLCAADI